MVFFNHNYYIGQDWQNTVFLERPRPRRANSAILLWRLPGPGKWLP